MSGQRETPGEAQGRRAVLDGEQPAVTASAGASRNGGGRRKPPAGPAKGSRGSRGPYGRRWDGPRSAPALVASAARLTINDRRSVESTRRRRQAWQTEAWDYFDEVGEIGYTTTYIANLMSKLRLYPAVQSPDGPVALAVIYETGEQSEDARRLLGQIGITPEVADLAIETLGRLRSMQGGQSAILRELSLNLEVAGECYIHGHAERAGSPEPGDTDDFDPGDLYGTDPGTIEDWNVRSVDELVPVGDEFQIRRGPGIKFGDPVPAEDLIIRIWERHPRFSELATCAMRRVLAEAEALLLLSREVRATSKSRLSNGILLIPSELSFGSMDPTHDEGDGEEGDDPFDDELQEAMITPIQEEGSASAVVPLVLRGPAELLQHVNHLALDKTLDPVLDARIEQRILRIARGLNMPTEVTTGLMATTFANAAQVKRSEFEDHIEPRAVLICDAITSGYFQWALEAAGIPPELAREIFCWFDASALIRIEDQSEQAVKAHEDGVISDAARRRYTGFTEEDAPDDAEILRRLLLRGGRMDPFIEANLFRLTGLVEQMPVPAPPAGILGHVESVSAMPVPGAPPSGGAVDPATGAPAVTGAPAAPEGTGATSPVTSSAARQANPQWAKLGGQLVGIDRELRGRITGKLDQAMRNALERAGQRIKAQLPQRDKGGAPNPVVAAAKSVPPDRVAATLGRAVLAAAGVNTGDLLDGAFDQALEDIATWMDVAYDRAVRALERCAGILPHAQRTELDASHTANVAAAVSWLRDNLTALAADRLYQPTPTTAPAGEHDGTVLIPANLVRAALAVAGGATPKGGSGVDNVADLYASAWLDIGGAGPVTTEDGGPLGGIGAGEDMMTAVGTAGASVEGWQWEYGAGMRSEFPPHLALDGTVVARTDDPAWANTESFPPTDFYFPGDHDGCVCDIIPVILGPQGMATESIEDLNTMEAAQSAADQAAADAAAQAAQNESAPAEDTNPEGLDDSGFSTLAPNDLADVLGYARGDGDVTEADLQAAEATYGQVKADVRAAAHQIAEDHLALLRTAGDVTVEPGQLRYVFNAADRAKQGDTGTGLYDWFDDLSPKEKARLRQNWFESRADAATSTASNYDEVAEALARVFGMDPTDDTAVMKRWVEETRIIDAAQSLANNKAINPDRYGGLDINELIDSPYDLRVLFGYKSNSAEEVAKVTAGETADEARQLLGVSSTYGGAKLGPAPWELTEAEYILEASRLEEAAREIVPVSEDEWDGPVYSTEDQATLDRLRELLPPALDNPDNPQALNVLYREILAVARTGGLI